MVDDSMRTASSKKYSREECGLPENAFIFYVNLVSTGYKDSELYWKEMEVFAISSLYILAYVNLLLTCF